MAASWLAEVREQVHLSQVWQEYSKELFDVMLQQLAEGHVDFFTDLSTSEKALFVDQAAKAINGGSTYRALVSRINSALEEQFGRQLIYKMHESKSMQARTEAYGSHIQDGVVSLLQKWPDMKSKLHILFNHSLPPDLRKLTWNLYLTNTKDAAKVMSNVLSYYQKIQHSSDYLSEANYLLLVPLVQVSLAATTPSTSLNVLSTQLVEEYVTFMEWWMREQVHQMTGSSADDNLFKGMANMLDEKDREVSVIIQKIYTQHAENQSREDLLRGLQSLLHPVIGTLFVGYLNMETLLYVWDQHIIGLGHPSYNCLPAFCLAFILLLREHLQICKTPGDVDVVLRSHAAELTSLQFQKVIKEHFYSNLYKSLTKQNTDVFTLLDSDREKLPPAWTHLFRNHLPYRSQPKERRQAREQLDAQHLQSLKEAKLTKQREDEEQRTKEKKLQRLLEESQRINQEQKISFEEKLCQERHLQYEMQRKAEEQVNQLQVEMRQVMQQRQFSTDAYSLQSFVPPPPASLESTSTSGVRKPGQSVPPEDLKITPPILTMNQHQPTGKGDHVTLDILHYLMNTINSITNGNGFGEQTLLNKTTQEQLQKYQQDVRNAEFQLFGHHLDSDELDRIHEPRRSELSRKLTDAVQRGVETRYRAHLSQQGVLSNSHVL
ncbi:uncharacterized protein LOC144606241 isoform X2 [Rhinoraja longicauda]